MSIEQIDEEARLFAALSQRKVAPEFTHLPSNELYLSYQHLLNAWITFDRLPDTSPDTAREAAFNAIFFEGNRVLFQLKKAIHERIAARENYIRQLVFDDSLSLRERTAAAAVFYFRRKFLGIFSGKQHVDQQVETELNAWLRDFRPALLLEDVELQTWTKMLSELESLVKNLSSDKPKSYALGTAATILSKHFDALGIEFPYEVKFLDMPRE